MNLFVDPDKLIFSDALEFLSELADIVFSLQVIVQEYCAPVSHLTVITNFEELISRKCDFLSVNDTRNNRVSLADLEKVLQVIEMDLSY